MKRKLSAFLYLLCCTCMTASAQQQDIFKKYGLIHHSFTDSVSGHVDFYITDSLHDQKKPVLIFLDGSGPSPIIEYSEQPDGTWQLYTTIQINYKALASKYHIVLLSKPGIPFMDSTRTGENLKTKHAIYNKYAGAAWRTQSTSKALSFILKNYKVDSSKIALMGYSEGGQLAPGIAVYDKRITHSIAFVGGGLNQLFDFIIEQRMAAAKGDISQVKAQQVIDSLFNVYEKIYADPASTDKYWYGHTYQRWGSFGLMPALEYYKQLDIPVYIAQGTNDTNTSILSTDYVMLEFLRLGKKNLTYKTYPDRDHAFKVPGKPEVPGIRKAVINEALEWLDKQNR